MSMCEFGVSTNSQTTIITSAHKTRDSFKGHRKWHSIYLNLLTESFVSARKYLFFLNICAEKFPHFFHSMYQYLTSLFIQKEEDQPVIIKAGLSDKRMVSEV